MPGPGKWIGETALHSPTPHHFPAGSAAVSQGKADSGAEGQYRENAEKLPGLAPLSMSQSRQRPVVTVKKLIQVIQLIQ